MTVVINIDDIALYLDILPDSSSCGPGLWIPGLFVQYSRKKSCYNFAAKCVSGIIFSPGMYFILKTATKCYKFVVKSLSNSSKQSYIYSPSNNIDFMVCIYVAIATTLTWYQINYKYDEDDLMLYLKQPVKYIVLQLEEELGCERRLIRVNNLLQPAEVNGSFIFVHGALPYEGEICLREIDWKVQSVYTCV